MYPESYGDSTLLIEGFEQHDALPSTLRDQATSVAAPAGDVESFNADLTTAHNTAEHGVSGVLAEAIADALTKAEEAQVDSSNDYANAAGPRD